MESQNLFANELVESRRIIYTPSSFAKENLLYLQETGSLRAIKPHVSSRSGLGSYLFFVVCEGSGELTYKGEVYKLSQGDCVFIDCTNPYSHCSSKNLWSLKWCHFYGPTLSGIYQKYMERGGHHIFRTDKFADYMFLLDELYELANSFTYIRDMYISNVLSSMATLIMEETRYPGEVNIGTSPKRNILEVQNYINTHYREPMSLESLAAQFFMSKHYLARCFKEQCGMTVLDYIQQVRITQAKCLLRFSNKSIEQIGEECGIPDANYFSRVFKKMEDMPPKVYRKMWNAIHGK